MLGLSEIGLILLIILVLFGATAIPKIARALGQAKGEFKKGMEESKKIDKSDIDKTDN